MKTAQKIVLFLLPAIFAACNGMIPAQHGRIENSGQAGNYQQHVPAPMRELVSEQQFHKLFNSLRELRDPAEQVSLLSVDTVIEVAASPCGPSLAYLAQQYADDPATQTALEMINQGFQDLPVTYEAPNPWRGHKNAGSLVRQILTDFSAWCTFLPEISGNQDNGLQYIQHFSWFYYRNPAAQDFVQGRDPGQQGRQLLTGLKFTRDFSTQRGMFMDSKASAANVAQWVNDPRIEIEDYIPPDGTDYHYRSWNDFFTRQIRVDKKNRTIPSRPATMPISEYPERDYIVVAPTDCIMNPLMQVLRKQDSVVRKYVENPLQRDMVLDVKNIPISLIDLFGDTPQHLIEKFIGGTGLSCVLMPNTYHHFHAPVNGKVVHAEIVRSGTYGYEDFPNWVPQDGNVGRPGTDFSQFQQFQRGVIVIEVSYKNVDGTPLTGYVASIPVGLDTIGSVVLDDDIVPGKIIKRGYTRLGNFYYGGSLDILLFSKGLASNAVQTRLGNQINMFNIGRTP